jgi:hypothetical protein
MKTRSLLVWIGAAVLVGTAGFAQAQKMYRCGNAYQDRPCEGAQPQGKTVSNWGGSSSGGSLTKDGPCSRRGADALKVVWARDNGAQREQQIADVDRLGLSTPSAEERVQIIESVYAKRGSAQEIRVAVESECLAEKERQAQAAALAATAARIAGGGAAPVPGARGPSESDIERMEARRQAEMEANAAAFKQSRCADLARQYENLRSQERTGGSAATMARHAERRRELDDRQRREGC